MKNGIVVVAGAGKWIFPCLLLLILLTNAGAHAADGEVRFDLGFNHWASDTFRKADDGEDLSLGIGYRLPIRWLELQGRYEWAHIKSPSDPELAAVDGERVDFFSAGLALVANDFTFGAQRAVLSFSLSALLAAVDGKSSGLGYAAGPSVEWLFDGRQGMLANFRKQVYDFPSRVTTDRQTDITTELGYVIRF